MEKLNEMQQEFYMDNIGLVYFACNKYNLDFSLACIGFCKAILTYKDNQVSADEKYKGKTVEFTAEVTYIADEYVVVQPSNADAFDWDCDVQICFEDMDDLKKVSEGNEFTIVGECYGKADMYTSKICRAIVK